MSDTATGDKMGRGRDLTDAERAFVHNKIMQNWDSQRRQIKEGGRKKVIEACVQGGVRIAVSTTKRFAQEAKLQEEESESHFLKTGEFKGMDFSACRKGNCGRASKLTLQINYAIAQGKADYPSCESINFIWL